MQRILYCSAVQNTRVKLNVPSWPSTCRLAYCAFLVLLASNYRWTCKLLHTHITVASQRGCKSTRMQQVKQVQSVLQLVTSVKHSTTPFVAKNYHLECGHAHTLKRRLQVWSYGCEPDSKHKTKLAIKQVRKQHYKSLKRLTGTPTASILRRVLTTRHAPWRQRNGTVADSMVRA